MTAPAVPDAPADRSAFWTGVRDGLPFMAALAPFGLLFGVAAQEAGLGLGAAMGFSAGVIAGASQFTAVSLMQDGAPALIVAPSASLAEVARRVGTRAPADVGAPVVCTDGQGVVVGVVLVSDLLTALAASL